MPNLIQREKLRRTNNNMDAIRYVLAFSVIVAHFNELTGSDIVWPVTSGFGVSGFFAMSGFLIYPEYARCSSAREFVLRRVLRIMPPYLTVVLVFAVGLCLVSALGPVEYFASGHWWRYLAANLSFMNFIEPTLPGVFEGGRYVSGAVNGSLWTMKVEWCLYLSVIVVAALVGRLRRRDGGRDVMFLLIIIFSIIYRYIFLWLFAETGREIYQILGRQLFAQLAFFYVGAMAYYHLDKLLRYRWIILAIFIAGLCVMRWNYLWSIALEPFVVGGLVIWLSMVGHWGRLISRHDNVSYDMYLFHYPIIQLAVYFNLLSIGTAWSFVTVMAAVVLISFLSWNCIGKKFARLKSKIVKK